ncbi:hypothetical protein [Mycoplasma sp. 'Moose RK']|uniref:hypothetical protein n=1 Tax=Mycoplasma sp. 'Moose RK' TaxID=2780095 RepID=UPI0018C2A217|nr:hypothetical protein [Mycoplasma sp. 'Moose RK']MBG0730784.1 hypothetical protein [Mycoplasma sp. 'Moose RK']
MKTIKDQQIANLNQKFAVIDIETNYENQIFSVGVVIADSTNFNLVDKRYWILENNLLVGGMYKHKILAPLPAEFKNETIRIQTHKAMINQLIKFLNYYNVEDWFSYTKFDFKYLPELHNLFKYNDISLAAKSKKFNKHIPSNAETSKNGNLKKGWNVEHMYRMVSKDEHYVETHNALLDAIDELRIMKFLELDFKTFQTLTKRKNNPIQIFKNVRTHIETIKDQQIANLNQKFAVINIKTNYKNKIFSVGVVIADSTNFNLVDKKYWILINNLLDGAMYSDSILAPLPAEFKNETIRIQTHKAMINQLIKFLNYYNVENWFSYTNFAFTFLPELHNLFKHIDIFLAAKSKKFNKHIPSNAQTYKNGNLKKGCGVEDMYRMVCKDEHYVETHNALLDAIDELRIMKFLELDFKTFQTLTKRR